MERFIIKGKYSGSEEDLPQREHPEGYVPFKEPEDMKKLAIYLNVASIILFIPLGVLLTLRGGMEAWNMWGILLSLAVMVPHEFLHGICMNGEVYMYQNLKQGMLFVLSTADMTKKRFIFMSMFPNLVFGFLPFLIFLINPELKILGSFGALGIAAGVGDYLNVYNAVTQVPDDALTYLSGMHSYWYRPQKQVDKAV